MDSSYDDLDVVNGGPMMEERGLLRPTSVYTQTRDGTYLEINEGRAYVPSFRELVFSLEVLARRIKLM